MQLDAYTKFMYVPICVDIWIDIIFIYIYVNHPFLEMV